MNIRLMMEINKLTAEGQVSKENQRIK